MSNIRITSLLENKANSQKRSTILKYLPRGLRSWQESTRTERSLMETRQCLVELLEEDMGNIYSRISHLNEQQRVLDFSKHS